MSSTHAVICTGKKDDGSNCDCSRFSKRDKRRGHTRSNKCKSCPHSKDRHLATIPPPEANIAPKATLPAAARPTADDITAGILLQNGLSLPSSSGSSSTPSAVVEAGSSTLKPKVSDEDTRQEMCEGFRPASGSSDRKPSAGKSKAGTVSHHAETGRLHRFSPRHFDFFRVRDQALGRAAGRLGRATGRRRISRSEAACRSLGR